MSTVYPNSRPCLELNRQGLVILQQRLKGHNMTLFRGTIRFLALCLLIIQRAIGDPYPGWKNGRFSGDFFGTNNASRGPFRPSEVLGSFEIPFSGSYGLNQPYNARAGSVAENNIHPTNTATRVSAFKSNVFDSTISPPEYNAGIGTFNNVPPTQTSNTEGVSYGQMGSDFTLEGLQNERPSSQINNQETTSYGTTIMPASTYGTTSSIRSGNYNRPSDVGTGANTVPDGSYFNTGRSNSEFGASDSPNTSTLENIEEVELTNKVPINEDNGFTSHFNSRGLNLNRDTVSGGGRYNPCGPGFLFGAQNLRSTSDPGSTTLSAQRDPSNSIDSSNTIDSSAWSNSETTVESVPVNSPMVESLVATDLFSDTIAHNNVVQQPPTTSPETVSFPSSSTVFPNTVEIFDTSDVQPIPMTSSVTVSHGATDPSTAIFIHNTAENLTPNIQQATIATSDIVSSDYSLPSTATVFQNKAGSFTSNVQQASITSSDIVPSTATLFHNTVATITSDIQKPVITSPEPISFNTILPVVQDTQKNNPGTFSYGLTDPTSVNCFSNTAGTSTPVVQEILMTGQVTDYNGSTDHSGSFVFHNTRETSEPVAYQTPVSSSDTVHFTSADPYTSTIYHNTARTFTPNIQQTSTTSSDIGPSTATLFHNTPATYTSDMQKALIMSPETISFNTIMPFVQETQINNPGTYNYASTNLSSANVLLNTAGTATPVVQEPPMTGQDYIGATDNTGGFVFHNTGETSKPVAYQTSMSSPGKFYSTSADPYTTTVYQNTAGTFTPNIQQTSTTSSDIVPPTATVFHNTPATFTPDIQKALITSPEPISFCNFIPVVQETQITDPGRFNYVSTYPSSANILLNTAGTSTPVVQEPPMTGQVKDYIGANNLTGAFVFHNIGETSKPVGHQTPLTFYVTSADPSTTTVYQNTAGTFTPTIQQAPITSSDIVPPTATLFHNTPATFTPDIQKALITSPAPNSFGTFIPVLQETKITNPGTVNYSSTYPANIFHNIAGTSTPVAQEPPLTGQVTDYIGATDPSGAFVFHNTGETSKPVIHQTPMNNPGTFYITSTDSSNTPTFQNTVEMSNSYTQPSTTTSPRTFYVSSSDPSSDTVFHTSEASTPVPQETSMTNPVIFHFRATDPSTGKVIYDTFGTSMLDLVPTEAVISGTNESAYYNTITSDIVSSNPHTSPETDHNNTSDAQISDKSVAPSVPDVEPTAETNSETASLGGNNYTNILSPHDTAVTSGDVVSDPEIDSIKKVDNKTFEIIADIPKSELSSAPTISPEADSVDNRSNGTAITSLAIETTSNTNSPENICESCSALFPKDYIISLLDSHNSFSPMTELKTFAFSPGGSDDYSISPHVSSNSTSPSLRDGSSHPKTPVEMQQSHLMEMMCIETVVVTVGTHCTAVPPGHSSVCTVPQKHHD